MLCNQTRIQAKFEDLTVTGRNKNMYSILYEYQTSVKIKIMLIIPVATGIH